MFARLTNPHSRHARTKLLGLFVAAWISLVLQPCAVAAIAESDCPHCPPETEAITAAVESHCNPAAEDAPNESPHCDSVQAECCDIDEGIVNARIDTTGGDQDTPGLPTSLPAAYPGLGLYEAPGNAAGPPEPSGRPVPIHVLKCVYLD